MLSVVDTIGQDLTLLKQSNNIYTTQEHDSLKIFVATNSWYWFSRRIGGDAASWLRYYREYSDQEAVEYIETNQSTSSNISALFRNIETVSIDSGIEPRQINGIKEYHPYIASRNITKETANHFHLEIINDSIAIPVYNFKNERIGVVLRNISSNDQKIKYRKIMKEKMPLLWPIEDWKRCTPEKICFIFEGAWGVMRFWQVLQNDKYCFLALFGVAANEELLQYLNGLNVIVILDNDKTGREMGKRLSSLNPQWRLKLPSVYPDEMTDEQIVKFMEHCK